LFVPSFVGVAFFGDSMEVGIMCPTVVPHSTLQGREEFRMWGVYSSSLSYSIALA